MDELLEALAREHIEQSLAELRDDTQRARWLDGTRAQEVAAQIVSRLVADAQKHLETGEQPNAC